MFNLFVTLIVLSGFIIAGCDLPVRKDTEALNVRQSIDQNLIVEIVAQKSVGRVSLGDSRKQLLDLGAKIDAESDSEVLGTLDGLSFSLFANVVSSVSVPLPNFDRALTYHGHKFSKKTTLAQLREIFGPCVSSSKLTSGQFKCEAAGVLLGSKSGDSDVYLSLQSNLEQ